MATRRLRTAVLTGVAGLLAFSVLITLPASASAQVCCIDRDDNGLCDGQDDPVTCTRRLVLVAPFPVLCTPGATLDCRAIDITAPKLTLAGTLHAANITLQSTAAGIDLRGASLTVKGKLNITSAGTITADQTTGIRGESRGGRRSLARVTVQGAADVDVRGAGVFAGKSLALTSTGGNVLASTGDYESGTDIAIQAAQGNLDISGSTVLAGRNMNVATGQGLTGLNSTLQARGKKGQITIAMTGGSADLSGAVVTADRSIKITGQSQVDQGMSLGAAQLRTFQKGNIDLQATGTMDVTNSIIEAAPPGDFSANVDLVFREPLVGTAASLIDSSGPQIVPSGLPPAGPQDTAQLVSDPFTVPPDIDQLTFEYMFLTNEVPPAIGHSVAHNDTFVAYLMNGTTGEIFAYADTRTTLQPALLLTGFSYFTPVFLTASIDVRRLAGTPTPLQVAFAIEDVGDSRGASAVLLDNILLRDTETVQELWIDRETDSIRCNCPAYNSELPKSLGSRVLQPA